MSKIQLNELDDTIIEMLQNADTLSETLGNVRGHVVNNNGTIEGVNVNNLLLNAVYTNGQIEELESHLYKSSKYIKSIYDTPFNVNINADSLPTMMYAIQPENTFKLDSEIVNVKEFGNDIVALNKNGVAFVMNKVRDVAPTQLKIADIIKERFVYDFNARDIIDYLSYKDGLLVSTKHNGVYFIGKASKDHECMIRETGVNHLTRIDKNTLLYISDDTNMITLYDLVNKEKIEVFNNLTKAFQKATRVVTLKDTFFIIARSIGCAQSERIIHMYKKDKAGSFDNVDYMIPENECDTNLQVKYMDNHNNDIVIFGIDSNTPFIWTLKEAEDYGHIHTVYFNNHHNVKYSDVSMFRVVDGIVYFNVRDRIVAYNANGMVHNYKLPKLYKHIFVDAKTIACIDTFSVDVMKTPKIERYAAVHLTIHEGSVANNIDFYMVGSGNESVTFFDELGQIVPHLHLQLNNGTINLVKLLGTNSTKIVAKIVFDNDKPIKGIVIKNNKIYTK